MTVVATRDVADPYRGFLASIMQEVATDVFYFARELSKGVWEHIWALLRIGR
jgi:CRISPR-associated protein Cas2